MRRLHQVQRELGCSVLVQARKYAQEGLSLQQLAKDLCTNYSSLKRNLSSRGHVHPRGLDLVCNRFEHAQGMTLLDYVKEAIRRGINRNALAEETGIDNKTLQQLAELHNLTFPKGSRQRDYTNIVRAMRDRQHRRDDLVQLSWCGKTMCLSDWSTEVGVPETTLRKRMKLGWTVERMLSEPVYSRGDKSQAMWWYRCPECKTLNGVAVGQRDHLSRDLARQVGRCRNVGKHAIAPLGA